MFCYHYLDSREQNQPSIVQSARCSWSMGSLTNNSTRYGFIGLGVMGWGMANNIRSKIAESDSLCVCELNKERLGQWLGQAPGKAPIKVAQTPKEVIEQSVSPTIN